MQTILNMFFGYLALPPAEHDRHRVQLQKGNAVARDEHRALTVILHPQAPLVPALLSVTPLPDQLHALCPHQGSSFVMVRSALSSSTSNNHKVAHWRTARTDSSFEVGEFRRGMFVLQEVSMVKTKLPFTSSVSVAATPDAELLRCYLSNFLPVQLSFSFLAN